MSDYPGGWFGISWGAPFCTPETHKETPVGKLCPWCLDTIEDGDWGMIVPHISKFMDPPLMFAYHRRCFVAGIASTIPATIETIESLREDGDA